jgi:uncharacterized protein (DUF427 family)
VHRLGERDYSVHVGGRTFENVVWSNRAATLESEQISGMVSFYNEQVDAILIDGKEVPKPKARRQ